jgi:hypothetical protein
VCLRALTKITGPKWNKVAGGRRRLHNEELHDLYPLSNTVWVIKSKGLGCAAYVARMMKR